MFYLSRSCFPFPSLPVGNSLFRSKRLGHSFLYPSAVNGTVRSGDGGTSQSPLPQTHTPRKTHLKRTDVLMTTGETSASGKIITLLIRGTEVHVNFKGGSWSCERSCCHHACNDSSFKRTKKTKERAKDNECCL